MMLLREVDNEIAFLGLSRTLGENAVAAFNADFHEERRICHQTVQENLRGASDKVAMYGYQKRLGLGC
jgi:hypothetical protein